MNVHIDTFWRPKAGHSSKEYEDAVFAPKGMQEIQELRIALADGASESFLAKRWARFLTDAFGQLGSQPVADFLKKTIADWPPFLEKYKRKREAAGQPLQWFEELSLEHGSYATLLGANFSGEDSDGIWHSISVGDTCIFQIRDDELLVAFPIESPKDFNLSPALVSTVIADLPPLLEKIQTIDGKWETGDTFYLMTDAIAQWFLNEVLAGNWPWRALGDFGSDLPPFSDWVDSLRLEERMRNDDVTVVRVDIF